MDTAWIQIFILYLTQCTTPAGEILCKSETLEMQFTAERDCETALAYMLEFAARTDTVIVDARNSHCRAALRQQRVFADADADPPRGGAGPPVPSHVDGAPVDPVQFAGLGGLPDCDDVAGVAPCRIGPILVEASAELDSPAARRQPN